MSRMIEVNGFHQQLRLLLIDIGTLVVMLVAQKLAYLHIIGITFPL